MNVKDKKVLVVGSGISGIAAVALLKRAGARPMLFDSNEKLTREEMEKRLSEPGSAACFSGSLPEESAKET
ncbi:MAG: NAD(P)-binding protein [Lachnospiraceae bacterium]|nr:NAD(P)-binding protein [Lachnospiraceae bacterium]